MFKNAVIPVTPSGCDIFGTSCLHTKYKSICRCKLYVAHRPCCRVLRLDPDRRGECLRFAGRYSALAASGGGPSSRGLQAAMLLGGELGSACTTIATRPAQPSSPVIVCHAKARCVAKPHACCSSRAGPQKLRLYAKGHADWRRDATVM